jgi:hypothetical protein
LVVKFLRSLLDMAKRFFGSLRKRVFQPVPIVVVDPPVIVVTPAVTDSTPNAFTFIDVTGATFGATVVSNTITVSGLSAGTFVAASISGDASSKFLKNSELPWRTEAVSVQNGDTLAVSHTAAVVVNTTLTVGGVSDTFTSTIVVSGAVGQPAGLLFAITRAT